LKREGEGREGPTEKKDPSPLSASKEGGNRYAERGKRQIISPSGEESLKMRKKKKESWEGGRMTLKRITSYFAGHSETKGEGLVGKGGTACTSKKRGRSAL